MEQSSWCTLGKLSVSNFVTRSLILNQTKQFISTLVNLLSWFRF